MTSVALAAVDTPAIAAPLSADDIARLLPHRYPFLMLSNRESVRRASRT